MSFFLWQCFTGIGSTYWKGLEWQGTLQCLVLPSVSRGCTWGPGKGTDVSGLWSVHSACTHSVLTGSLWTPGLQPSRLLCPWDSPGKNTGVGCHFLLQGISPSLCMKVKVLVAQSCLILFNPLDCSPPGSSVHGILQARILEWVAIP